MIKIIIDDKKFETKKDTTLLQACLDNDIYIPNLCYLKDMPNPPTSCRLCFVEIEGEKAPVNSCATKVKEGMIVHTDTDRIRNLQAAGFELLMSTHHLNCKDCSANKNCELQKISKFLHVSLKPKRLSKSEREVKVEEHPYLNYLHGKCVICGKCIYTCQKLHGRAYLSFAKRGIDTTISFYGETNPDTIPCNDCFACVDVCPVGAMNKLN